MGENDRRGRYSRKEKANVCPREGGRSLTVVELYKAAEPVMKL